MTPQISQKDLDDLSTKELSRIFKSLSGHFWFCEMKYPLKLIMSPDFATVTTRSYWPGFEVWGYYKVENLERMSRTEMKWHHINTIRKDDLIPFNIAKNEILSIIRGKKISSILEYENS